MRLFNGKIFYKGSFIDGGIDFGEKINAAGDTLFSEGDIDAEGCFVIPGLIDIHTHGGAGADASDGNEEGLERMSLYYASNGVTSWCPATMTLKEPELKKAMSAIAGFTRPFSGAKIAGINMEGPFLSSEKKGAQNEDNLYKPDICMFRRLYDVSGGIIKIVSVAPELEGALEFIKEACMYAAVSVAHTAADYNTAMRAFDAGASHVTHLFNAMPGIHHRNPGVIPAASDAGVTVELITDGIHIDPAVIRMTDRLFNDKLVLISDSLRCAGMPDGEYELGGQKICLKDNKATVSGTDTIAGSCIHLMDGLKRAVKYGVPLERAVAAASITPARVIKMDKEIGSVDIGKSADFVILDNDLNIRSVFINGRRI